MAVKIHITIILINPPPTKTYTLSLHDALPISHHHVREHDGEAFPHVGSPPQQQPYEHHDPDAPRDRDRKSTRLNSSHITISYAVFCLKKKKYTHSLKTIVRHLLVNSL